MTYLSKDATNGVNMICCVFKTTTKPASSLVLVITDIRRTLICTDLPLCWVINLKGLQGFSPNSIDNR